MRESLRLGHVFGVRVGINWSVLVIFLLITFGLAAGRFPVLVPDLSPAVYAAAGLAAAVIFFLSLLAHEVSHAVVARRHGIGVEGITLWLFGGVARLEGEAETPGADLRIAGVGPLTSLILGVVFGGLALAGGVIGLPAIVVDVLLWLGVINVALAVFNLVPAAPLDGGRILRALVWRARGDRLKATVTATRAGQVFGFLVIGLGLAEIILLPGFGGLWLMLIGWFIAGAASAEQQQAKTRARLGDVRVSDVMSDQPATVPRSLTLDRLIDEHVMRKNHSTFPVTDEEGRPVGLITLNRVKQVPRDDWASTRVEDVACSGDEVATARPGEPLSDLLDRMSRCADGRVLVVDDDRLVGLVAPADVTRRLEIAELRGDSQPTHL